MIRVRLCGCLVQVFAQVSNQHRLLRRDEIDDPGREAVCIRCDDVCDVGRRSVQDRLE